MNEGVNYDKLETFYEVTALAVDNNGRNIIVYISKYPDSQSGPPLHWDKSNGGHLFSTIAAAREAVNSATGSYNISRVFKDTVQIHEYEIAMRKETRFIRVVKDEE